MNYCYDEAGEMCLRRADILELLDSLKTPEGFSEVFGGGSEELGRLLIRTLKKQYRAAVPFVPPGQAPEQEGGCR